MAETYSKYWQNDKNRAIGLSVLFPIFLNFRKSANRYR